ncbi:TIGR04063 family PEP-CTERM/XrtA system glycosyltransferase [Sphingomonas sp.]|jgi:PEP-CTERM/exosortase A-associated glycosyltransferase|uniref:TIGR04063 family PEP-CTERM/XrtA system glycosyltransferase n=1 Tax=Sphingomonas sp. TaxID=28214 RepID=UPI002E1529A9|nr:TIGR04063 family PEP-CTERM/XrtA system glycosyltransferase [Sphingomonas sp.]HEV7288515.1 TIGR04063 family PEP-CTERM/XrtA system glycosyltransferase [Sphingomonas sp.]
MRILHVLDHSLPLHSGYTFRTRAILKAQMERGWTVAGVTGPRYHTGDSPFETLDGIDFHRTKQMRRLPPVVGELAEIAAFARRIGDVVERFRPDILHAHSPVIDPLAAMRATKRYGLPLLYEIRAFWEDAAVGNGTGTEGSAKYRAIRGLETWAARRVDGVAVICEGLKRDLIARGIDAGKIMVSPNGVDLHLFGDPVPRDEVLAAQLGLDGADTIGFIGSFYDYEGLDDLIAAMPALLAQRPQARLVMVGGGPMEQALRAQAAASSAAHAIHFVGRVPHEQVERYYSLIDLLVYPRKHMRLTDLVTPLKPIEAMAQHRLVAASDVGGHRELIRHGDTGTLFPPDDPAALARSVAGVFADRSGWDAQRVRARRWVEAERNWSSNISRYEPVYQSLIATRTRESKWLRTPSFNV